MVMNTNVATGAADDDEFKRKAAKMLADEFKGELKDVLPDLKAALQELAAKQQSEEATAPQEEVVVTCEDPGAAENDEGDGFDKFMTQFADVATVVFGLRHRDGGFTWLAWVLVGLVLMKAGGFTKLPWDAVLAPLWVPLVLVVGIAIFAYGWYLWGCAWTQLPAPGRRRGVVITALLFAGSAWLYAMWVAFYGVVLHIRSWADY